MTGWSAIPGPNGTTHGMRLAGARGNRGPGGEPKLPIEWLRTSYLGADRGIFEPYGPNLGDTSTYDSYGNHEVIPPYVNGSRRYPLGRILVGGGDGISINAQTNDFYNAQGLQGEPLVVDVSWLGVGHVDEVFSFVPAPTPRG